MVTRLMNELAAFLGAGKMLFSCLEIAGEQGRDGDTVLRVPDRGLEELLETQVPEALVHGFNPGHESGNQSFSSFGHWPFREFSCQRRQSHVADGNCLGIGFIEIGMVSR